MTEKSFRLRRALKQLGGSLPLATVVGLIGNALKLPPSASAVLSLSALLGALIIFNWKNIDEQLSAARVLLLSALLAPAVFFLGHYSGSRGEIRGTDTTELHGLRKIYLRSADIHGDLGTMVETATSDVWFVGINFFTSVVNQRERILDRLAAGVTVRFLVLQPTSSLLPLIANDLEISVDKLQAENHDTVRGLHDITRIWRERRDALANPGELQIRFHDTVVHGRAYVIDPKSSEGSMIIVPYVNIGNSPSLPAYLLRREENSAFLSYYEALGKFWEGSLPPTQAALSETGLAQLIAELE